jgi:hypothetical protein
MQKSKTETDWKAFAITLRASIRSVKENNDEYRAEINQPLLIFSMRLQALMGYNNRDGNMKNDDSITCEDDLEILRHLKRLLNEETERLSQCIHFSKVNDNASDSHSEKNEKDNDNSEDEKEENYKCITTNGEERKH